MVAALLWTITLRADGRLSFAGPGYQDSRSEVRLDSSAPERADTVVSPAITRAAFDAFESGWSQVLPNRFQMKRAACVGAATDQATVYVVRFWADRSDTVEVYDGCAVIPVRLTRLATTIDSLAGCSVGSFTVHERDQSTRVFGEPSAVGRWPGFYDATVHWEKGSHLRVSRATRHGRRSRCRTHP